jgi:two-component system CheB/CheR fusion protein
MPVVIIDEGVVAQSNTVYIKPPDRDISILHGSFTLLRPSVKESGSKMSVDIFFRHLADDQDGKAVGIILSGMGSDGTLGIRAIKEHAGMAMAQEPSTAKFDGMPQSAIATGVVDYVASPEYLPEMLISYVNASSKISQAQTNIQALTRPEELIPQTPAVEGALARIFVLVRSRTTQDFSQYKRSTIMRRIERRMSLHQLTNMNDYVRLLQENPSEIEILAKEMLIGVTQFFRDPEAWHSFQKDVLPGLIQSKSEGRTLRVWVVGCSTGEEAYTLAIILQESLADLGKSEEIEFQIFATDTDSDAIDVARTGKYPSNIEMDVSPERLERFFSKGEETYQISQNLRDRVTFAQHNVISDPPFAHLDILSCRNLLIYLSPEMQKRLIQIFHYALDPNGILILGTSESISGYSDLFSTTDSKYKIFQKRDVLSHLHEGLGEPLAVFSVLPSAREARVQPHIAAKEPSIATVVQEHLVQHFAPPSIVTTENGDIMYIQGQAGKYLYPSPGKANLNVLAMAREGLRHSILSALRVAAREKRDVEREETVRTNGEHQRVRLIVQPISKRPGRADLYLVAFQDMPEPQQAQPAKPIEGAGASEPDVRIAELERELTETRTELQRNAEEKQSAQEELTSINEELQSTNEELQSTNEELTTSKEELQSMNEEILTVNSELQAKIAMLSQNQDDMRNLLQSTRIPMIFLDEDLKVRRFTEDTEQIVHLIERDIGRDITDLKINLIDESLPSDAQNVLDTLQVIEKQVKTTDEKWFQMIVRPYRTFRTRLQAWSSPSTISP